MQRLIKIFFLILFLSALRYPLSATYAAVPHLLNYQGRLTDSGSKPLTDGIHTVTFRIYDAETAGNLLWQGTYPVTTQKGIFNVLLGDISDTGYNFSSLTFDRAYFLEIKVEAEVMSPRQRITSSGYALRAEDAEKLGSKLPADYALASDITTTPTASKAVRLDTNAKLPLSALKVYDSGWFAVTAATTYTKTHSLGTTKVITMFYFSDTPDGSGKVGAGIDHYVADHMRSTCLVGLTPTAITVRTGNYTIFDQVDEMGNAWYNFTNCYLRIVMLALE